MARIKDITDYIDVIAPPETAEAWDNPGLQTGKLRRLSKSAWRPDQIFLLRIIL